MSSAVVRFHDAFAYVETEPQPAPIVLAELPAPLEHVRQRLLVDARPALRTETSTSSPW